MEFKQLTIDLNHERFRPDYREQYKECMTKAVTTARESLEYPNFSSAVIDRAKNNGQGV
jgi:hypothetical protein